MKKIFFISLFFLTAKVFAENLSPIGIWMVSSDDAKVEIYQKDNELEGKIIWLKEPKDEKGIEKTDTKNPDDKLKAQPIMNMIFLKNLTSRT